MESTIRRNPRENYSRRKKNSEEFEKRVSKIIKQLIVCIAILVIGITINNIDSSVTNYLSDKVGQIVSTDTDVDILMTSAKEFFSGLNISNEKFKSVFNTHSEDEIIEPSDESKIPEQYKDRIFEYSLLSGMQFETPTLGILTSGFGNRINPLNAGNEFHNGIDIGADEGNEIKAVLDGVVKKVASSESLGNYIEIDHIDGLHSLYAHTSFIDVSEGDLVGKGSVIGKVGSTGWSNGPHLHFELWKDDKMINPEKLFQYKSSGVENEK